MEVLVEGVAAPRPRRILEAADDDQQEDLLEDLVLGVQAEQSHTRSADFQGVGLVPQRQPDADFTALVAQPQVREPPVATADQVQARGPPRQGGDFVGGVLDDDGLPPRDDREAAEMVLGVALAMAEAHRLGVTHRDLKAANIRLTPDGQPVVVDFGLAFRLDVPDELRSEAGLMAGTPSHMPPEQVRADVELVGPVSDVWALGVIAYRLLTGTYPFGGATRDELFEVIIGRPPRPPRESRPHLDAELEAICPRALAKDLADRFESMAEFAAALARHLGRPPDLAPRPRPPVRRQDVRLAFVAQGGERAPEALQDRLYLDAGNDLRRGVIDHHHLTAHAGSTADLVISICHEGVASRKGRFYNDPRRARRELVGDKGTKDNSDVDVSSPAKSLNDAIGNFMELTRIQLIQSVPTL